MIVVHCVLIAVRPVKSSRESNDLQPMHGQRGLLETIYNIYMCKYTSRVNIHLLRQNANLLLHIHVCIFYMSVYLLRVHMTNTTYMYICIFGHVDVQQIYTRIHANVMFLLI